MLSSKFNCIYSTMKPKQQSFETLVGGTQTSLHFLKNKNNLEVAITNYGARIVGLYVPAPDGEVADVVVGFDSIEGYLQAKDPFHGTIVGRYANRIKEGRFTLDGKTYQLA